MTRSPGSTPSRLKTFGYPGGSPVLLDVGVLSALEREGDVLTVVLEALFHQACQRHPGLRGLTDSTGEAATTLYHGGDNATREKLAAPGSRRAKR